jgi:hypothetical protein
LAKDAIQSVLLVSSLIVKEIINNKYWPASLIGAE